MFLSTPPSRVATLGVGELNVSVYVSIHATLAGGDLVPRTRPRRASLFLSTPPSRVATRCLGVGSCALWRFYPRHPRGWRQARNWKARQNFSCFYPRHPRGWRPPNQQRDQRDGRVSIHATLAGGDRLTSSEISAMEEFLSTPPSRVATRIRANGARNHSCFYPRHPRGWRLASIYCILESSKRFYPRHPRGWRRHSRARAYAHLRFYPRHPRGWRPDSEFKNWRYRHVSIHATLAGGD